MRAIFRSPTKASIPSSPRRRRAAPDRRRLAVAVLLLAGLVGAARGYAADEVNRVILRVNDRIITLFDYRERLDERERSIRKSDLPANEMLKALAAAPNGVLREMMDEVLLLSRGDQLSTEIPESRIDEAVNATRKNMGLEDEGQWQEALQAYGMTEAAFRARTRDSLLFQEVVGREVRQKIKVNDEDLQRYYREHPKEFEVPAQYKLRDLVVLEGAGRSAQELTTFAAELRHELDGGKSLEDLAALYAPLKRTSSVTDLGVVTSGELDKALEAAIANVPVKGYSQPTPGRGGIHILQVLEHTPAKLRDYSEVQAELESAERTRRMQGELATYMADLEKQAYVVANPPAEAAGFRATAPRTPDSGLDDLQSGGTPPAAQPAPQAATPAAASAKPAAPPAKPEAQKPAPPPPAH